MACDLLAILVPGGGCSFAAFTVDVFVWFGIKSVIETKVLVVFVCVS